MTSKGSNPFFTEDDDDLGFSGNKGYGQRDEYGFDAPTSRRDQLLAEAEQSRARQLASTQAALSSIYDSERMGIATAEELVHQGEQLDNVERKVTSINQQTKTSQKHINNIKSIFGGLKNWFSGGKEEEKKEEEEEEPTKRSEALTSAIERDRSRPGEHPALRIRSPDYSGFYENEGSASDRGASSSSLGYNGHSQKQQSYGGARSEHDDQVDNNLDMMSDGMSRLKNLAMGLGDEIQTQNEQLDRIDLGAGRAHDTIDDQNRQMRRILHK